MPKKKKGKRSGAVGASAENESESPIRISTSVPLQARRDALKHLQETFASQVDPDVVYFILSECDYNVEVALENLLTLASENGPTTDTSGGLLDDYTSKTVFAALKNMNPSHLDSFEDDASSDSSSHRPIQDEIRCNLPCATSSLYSGPQDIYVSNEDLYTGDGSMEKFKSCDQFMFDSRPTSFMNNLPTNLGVIPAASPTYSAWPIDNGLVTTSANCDNIDTFANSLDSMKISVSSHSESSVEADASESVITPKGDNPEAMAIVPNSGVGFEHCILQQDEFYIQDRNPPQTSFRPIDSPRSGQSSPFVDSDTTDTSITQPVPIAQSSSQPISIDTSIESSPLVQHIIERNSPPNVDVHTNMSDLLHSGKTAQFSPVVPHFTESSNPTDSTIGQDSVSSVPLAERNVQTSMIHNLDMPQFVPQWIVPTLPNHQQSKRTPTPTNSSSRPPFWCYANGAQMNKMSPRTPRDLNTTGANSAAALKCTESDNFLCTKERIIQNTNRAIKVLVILRGLPGSGKSTLAQQLKRGGIILSTDNYFWRKDQYVYDPTKLSEAHEWNKHLTSVALKESRSPVIIDNTNTESWEMKPYVLLGLQYDYNIEILEPDTPWRFQPKMLAIKNSHNVSKDKIKIMLERYERHVSVHSILASSNARSLLKLKQHQSSVCNKPIDEIPDQKSQPNRSLQRHHSPKEVSNSHQQANPLSATFRTESSFNSAVVTPRHEDIPEVSMEPVEVTEDDNESSSSNKMTNSNESNSVQTEQETATDSACSLDSTKRVKRRKNNIVYPTLPDDYNVEDPQFWAVDATSSETPDDEMISSPINGSVATSRRRRVRQRQEQGNATIALTEDKPVVETLSGDGDDTSWYSRPSITLTDNDWKESHGLALQSSPSTDELLSVFPHSDSSSLDQDKVDDKLIAPKQTSSDRLINSSLPSTCQRHRSSRKKLAAMFSQAYCADCNWEIPQFPEPASFSNAVVEDSRKNASTKIEGKYFQLADSPNLENSETEGIIIRISRKVSICDRSRDASPQMTVGSCKKDVGCMTDDNSYGANSDFLRSCFPDLPALFVEDVFNKCAGNIEWAASILVDPSTTILTTSDPAVVTLNQSDHVSGNKGLHGDTAKPLQASVVENNADSESTAEEEDTSQTKPKPNLKPKDTSIEQDIDKMPSPRHQPRKLVPPTEGQCRSSSSNENAEDISENDLSSSGMESPKVSMKLDPAFAQQLEQLFGPVGFSASAGSKDDDLTFQIDINLAWHIHQCWTSNLQKKTEDEDLQFENAYCGDSVAKEIQKEVTAGATQMSTVPKNKSSQSISQHVATTPTVLKKSSSVPNLQEIMDLEMALQLSKEDAAKHRENALSNVDMATRLKQQKMYDMFPTLDRETLDEIFTAHNFSLTETVQALQEQNCDKDLISEAFLASYEQEILDAVIKESLENSRVARPTALIRPLGFPGHNHESEFQDFRSEATLHYRMRQECFAKAQAAYTSGKKAVASFYAQQGHLHRKKMWEANQRASRKILMYQNMGREKNTIDLHLLYIPEAINLLGEYLTEMTEELQHCSDRKTTINVIVGRGRHSADKVPRLKLAISNYLRQHNYRFVEVHAGLLQVILT